ncbi:hypothetical protein [Erysipelothrix sp. strain 2 (EsS2-6-Brazil)]|uniref:hypothetical protein n=1 Tax=Erysipelothrix sp. strain 2 (EsS2-6-Brazil) TaxID=2500549 RepID=UPI00190D2D31|nr:hypothetical protein [Erysipelothrix sp. strain 2 (EsS2-6-Brazil)]
MDALNCKQLKKRIKDYKVLALLILVGLMTVTWLGWENRPAQMRSARYTNVQNYETITGSYDFTDTYTYFESLGAPVSQSLFKLEKPYTYNANKVDVVFQGYELVELEQAIQIGTASRTAKTKRYLIIHVVIENHQQEPIVVKNFQNFNFERDYLTAIKTDASYPNLNWTSASATGGQITIQPESSQAGDLLVALSPTHYANLFMDGGIKVESPEIDFEDDLSDDRLFESYRQLDLPIAETEVAKIYDTSAALPTNMLRSANGHGVVTEQYLPDVTFKSEDGLLSATLERIDFINAEYKPSYREGRRYAEKGVQRSMVYRVRFENHGTRPIQVTDLQTALESVNTGRKRSNYPASSRSFINPNEPKEVLYELEEHSNSVMKINSGDQLEFTVVSESNRTLLTGTFTLEK